MLFALDKTSDFDCPYCGKAKLTPKRKPDGKHAMLNGLSPEHRKYHETSSEFDELEVHTFALALECTNPDCKMMTVVVGRLDAYPDYSGEYREYETTLSPRYFYPPLDVVPVPGCVPDAIRAELRRSYALYFADPSSAANPLRSAVECFMDSAGIIKARAHKGKHLALHERLVEFKKTKPDLAELLGAVKWLGNDGSHYGQGVTAEDLIKAYQVFLHAITKYYADPDSLARGYAHQIGKGRGL